MSSKNDSRRSSSDRSTQTSMEETGFLDPFDEYSKEIIEYLRAIEVNPDIPSITSNVSEKDRFILVEWLIQIHQAFKLKRATLFRAIQILDRVLTKVKVPQKKLQLVGATCMNIASKYEDIYSPEFGEFVYVAGDSFTKQDIVDMEAFICAKLKFRFSLATYYDFSARFMLAAASIGNKGKPLEPKLLEAVDEEAYFFLKLALLQYKCLEHKVSGVAAACVYLAFQRYELEWNKEMIAYTDYDEDEMKECVMLVYSLYRKERDMLKSGTGKPSVVSKEHWNKFNGPKTDEEDEEDEDED